jgi:hypothetical protein
VNLGISGRPVHHTIEIYRQKLLSCAGELQNLGMQTQALVESQGLEQGGSDYMVLNAQKLGAKKLRSVAEGVKV